MTWSAVAPANALGRRYGAEALWFLLWAGPTKSGPAHRHPSNFLDLTRSLFGAACHLIFVNAHVPYS